MTDDEESMFGEPVEPGSPVLEHVIFFVLGILATLAVIGHIATIPT